MPEATRRPEALGDRPRDRGGPTPGSRHAYAEQRSPTQATAPDAEPPGGRAPLPDRARVVVIGGGIIGCSVAYHLAGLGWRDVLLLERDRLTSGTTWHSAGLVVSFGSFSQTSTELRTYSRDLYARLESETGLSTGLRQVGFIELATDPDRLEEYRRVSAFNRHLGVDVHELSPREVSERFPLARTDDVLAGFFVAEDGRVNPVDLTMSLARGARLRGATILERTPVLGIRTTGGAVAGVQTPDGEVAADFVVNCAGMWARQLGAGAGVSIPLQAAEHYYLVTDRIAGISASFPVLEDPGSFGYFREETGGLLVGLFEPVCAPWGVDGIPDGFSFGALPADWERVGPYLETAMRRVPATLDAGVRKLFCGPESFTPDLQPVVGEAPELRGYFVAAGLNSIGVLTGGGIGRLVAHWIVDGRPGLDVSGLNIDRLRPEQANPEYLAARTVESLGLVYQCHYPYRSMRTARGARHSPVHDRLAAAGASFREISGWEAADWFAPPAEITGTDPAAEPGLSWHREPWFDAWATEHRAAREAVALMDLSFMSKFLVHGADAGRFLNRLSTANVDREPGTVTYTQWLNELGTIEADLTVTKLDPDRFWVVASDVAQRHVLTWMRRQLRPAERATVTDLTSGYAQLNVHGPRAREVVQSVTSADLSNAAFPYRAARQIEIGFARALCIRIGYVGELGYELHVPADQAGHVYDRLVAGGNGRGLRHAGLRALSSLRLEKAYRDYGHDIDNTDNVLEAGLAFTADTDKPDGFIGRSAFLRATSSGPATRRLIQVLLTDPEPLLFQAEIVRRDGVPVGYVRSAAYGFTLGGAVGLAMVDAGEPVDKAYLERGNWTVEVAGGTYPANVSLRPLYDPLSVRVRA